MDSEVEAEMLLRSLTKALETVEKMKEVNVLARNVQVQSRVQEQKMVEQNSNDLNQI